MSEAVGVPPEAKQTEREAIAVRVPGFDVGWPKIAALAAAIVLSVGGGFWTLSSTIYGDLKERLAHNEARSDSLDALTGVLRESVAKQGAQLDDLTKTVAALAIEVKTINADLTRQIRESNADLARQLKESNADLTRQMKESNADLTRQMKDSNTDLARQIGALTQQVAQNSLDTKDRLSSIENFLRGARKDDSAPGHH